MRVLSGIQPTGRFHWGNYFGAIRQYIDLQNEEAAYYFIANLHALTTVREPDVLRQFSTDAAIDLLALGLNPDQAILFLQSDVPEVSELTWLLMTGTPMGLLERCHAYKDKKARGLSAEAGLFTYPVLMAADILAYDSDVVPVGDDQLQHIEVCRDLAVSFNHHFGEVFRIPKAKILDSSAKVPGTDGEKMSKSYNNTLELFEDPKAQRKKIMRIPTDSRPMDEPKDPDTDHLFQLYSLVATVEQRDEMADTYRRGGFGYGDVKKALASAAEAYFAEPRQRRERLAADPDRVHKILENGAAEHEKRPATCFDGLNRLAVFASHGIAGIEMNVLGIGTDIIECLRIAQLIERYGERFINRVFTDQEIQYCQQRHAATQHFAGRWAAKEAVLKSLGTGRIKGINWRDLEVRNDKSGQVKVAFRGGLRDIVEQKGIKDFRVSVSHCRSHATAFAIALGDADELDDL